MRMLVGATIQGRMALLSIELTVARVRIWHWDPLGDMVRQGTLDWGTALRNK